MVRVLLVLLLLWPAVWVEAATRYWVGGAPAVAQVDSVTPANVEIGDVFTITINGRAVSFTATAGTVANVCTGLAAACVASTVPEEFTEITWSDQTTYLKATSTSAGVPFTLTTSTTDGGGANTQTLTRAAVTANAGPYVLTDEKNWDGGTDPTTGDDLVFQRKSDTIQYDLEGYSAETFASVTVEGWTGTIGLPNQHAGADYAEYRPKYFKAGITSLVIGNVTGLGVQSGLLRFDCSNIANTTRVYGTGTPTESGSHALEWKGTNAANVVEVFRGTVGIGMMRGDSATVATLRVGFVDTTNSDALVNCGAGCTLTAIEQTGGVLGIRSNPGGTLYFQGGRLYVFRGVTSLGTLDYTGGPLILVK